MKQLRLSLAVLVATSLLALPAAAKDLNGRFGVGGGFTLLGNGGLQLKYFAGHLGIAMLGSYLNTSKKVASAKDASQSGDYVQNEQDVSLRVSYNIARAKDTNFIGGGGLTYGNYSFKDQDGNEDSWNEMGFELFVGVEHFFGNHFSLTFETGLPIRFPGEKGAAIGNLTGNMVNGLLGEGRYLRFGSVAPTLASSFNFYF